MVEIDYARKNIGMRVSYTAYIGDKSPETGNVVGVTQKLIQVKFDGDRWAKSCRPESLVSVDED